MTNLLRLFSSFAMALKEKCSEWMNPTHSWDWQLLCHQQLISLDAGGGRTHISPERDGFAMCVGLTLANLNMRLKRRMITHDWHSTCYTLEVNGSTPLTVTSKIYVWWPIWGYLFDLRDMRSLILTVYIYIHRMRIIENSNVLIVFYCVLTVLLFCFCSSTCSISLSALHQ